MKNTDRSAFPVDSPKDPCMVKNPGMTLREYYAGQALAGILACSYQPANEELMAKKAVRLADALIAELDGGE